MLKNSGVARNSQKNQHFLNQILIKTVTNSKLVSLQQELESLKANFIQTAHKDKKLAYENGIVQITNSDLVGRARNKGQQAIDFTLLNTWGHPVSLFQFLDRGPVILTWYRGGWCPYCDLTLRALQAHLPKFKQLRANLLALSPELPNKSLSTREKHSLEFEVLTDLHNGVARRYGLVFQVPPDVMVYYNQAFDLNEFNGESTDELPLAATYVIDTKRVIRYAFLDPDYRNRSEPDEILKQLEQLSD